MAKAAAQTRNAKPAGSTRERIVAAAERLFAAQGFDGVSMPEIAKAAGITAGAIYKHFDGKAALFFEVVARAVQASPVGSAADAGSADPALPAVVAAYTDRSRKRLRQMAVEVHYASAKHPEVRKLLRRSLDREIGQIGDGIAGAQREGFLDAGLDPELTATALMTFIMGLMHLETLAPQLIGDPAWRAFVQDRTLALIGAAETPIRESAKPT